MFRKSILVAFIIVMAVAWPCFSENSDGSIDPEAQYDQMDLDKDIERDIFGMANETDEEIPDLNDEGCSMSDSREQCDEESHPGGEAGDAGDLVFQEQSEPRLVGYGITFSECGVNCDSYLDDLGNGACTQTRDQAVAYCDAKFQIGQTIYRRGRGLTKDQERAQGPFWRLCVEARTRRCNKAQMHRFRQNKLAMCRCGACSIYRGDLGDEMSQYCERYGFGAQDNRARFCREHCMKSGQTAAVTSPKAECDASKNYNCAGKKASFNTKICMEVRKVVCHLKRQGGRFLNWIKNIATGDNRRHLNQEILNSCVKICKANGIKADRGLDKQKNADLDAKSKREPTFKPKIKPHN